MSNAANFLNPVTRSYYDKLQADRLAYCERIQQLREYDIGAVELKISTSEKAKLGDDKVTFNINIVGKNNRTIRNRLTVQTMHVNETGIVDKEAAKKRGEFLSNIARKWWRNSRMDRFHKDLHYAASRDGDCYVVVEYDNESRMPMFYVNWAFDGESGVDIHYLEGNPLKKLRATKRWDEGEHPDGTRLRRMNIYEDKRVLKLVNSRANEGENADWGWEPYTGEEGEEQLEIVEVEIAGDKFKAGLVWWTDDGTENGTPLGIPVFHFANDSTGDAYGRASNDAIVPDLQDAINQASASYIIAARNAGFDRTYIAGIDPDTENIELAAGDILKIEERDVVVGSLLATNLEQLGRVIERYLKMASLVADIPFHNLVNPTGQIAAEGTLQQQEAPLLALIENNQIVFGIAYEDMLRMAYKLDVVFNRSEDGTQLETEHGLTLEQIEALDIDTVWKDAQTRSETAVLEQLRIKKELGVPDSQLWREMPGDYTEEQIMQFEATNEATSILSNQTQQTQNLAFQSQLMRNLAAENIAQRNGARNGNGVENVRQPEPA